MQSLLIRAEDKNVWEKRTPLVPDHVREVLDATGGEVYVERSDKRAFADADYLGAGARYNVVDIYRGGGGEELEVWSIEYAQVLLHDDQDRLLRAAGFSPVEFFGSYRFKPYDKKKSRVLIAVAEK